MLGREHVQGQETVFVVKRVEEPPFPPAVDGVVGRVEVDEHYPHLVLVPLDAVVPVALGFAIDAELKPVERALSRHGSNLSRAGSDDVEKGSWPQSSWSSAGGKKNCT